MAKGKTIIYVGKTFEEHKAKMLKMVDELINEYDEFTQSVSPKHWRTTGHHFAELRKMKEDIPTFTEITAKESKAVQEFKDNQ